MLISAAHILIALAAQAVSIPSYWGELRPGPHAIGFSQRWVVDSTRVLPSGEEYGMRYRPILLNVWYPAEPNSAAPMPYSDLFDGAVRAASADPALVRYARALMDYQRGVAWRELAGAAADSTVPAVRDRLEGLLNSRTAATRDAAPRDGRWPVVVYTQGAQSSMDDNIVLCEFLASHGYLVLGSAYPEEANTGFGTDASDESRQRDIRRLLWEVSRLRGYAPDRVVGIGHSAGAQVLQLFASDPSMPIDALISLDTTEDYSTLSDRAWAYYTDDVVARRKRIDIPMMIVAGRGALFELADSLVASDRLLTTVPDLGHNEFISQGIIRGMLRLGLPGEEALAQAAAEQAYVSLAECVRRWLDATGEPCPSPVEVQYAPPGVGFPPVRAGLPQSAREIRHAFSTLAPSKFAALVGEVRTRDEDIASNSVLMMLLSDVVRIGAAERARAMFSALVAEVPATHQVLEAIERRALLFERIGAVEEGQAWRRIANTLAGAR